MIVTQGYFAAGDGYPSGGPSYRHPEICHAAKAGEFTVTHHNFTIPLGGEHQAAAVTPPPRPVPPAPPLAEPVNLADELRAMGLM